MATSTLSSECSAFSRPLRAARNQSTRVAAPPATSNSGASTIKRATADAEPVYAPLEELFNGWSHAFGAALGLCALIGLLIITATNPSPEKFASAIIYGISFIALYSVSAAYHFAQPGMAKRILRTLDHSTIYLLIAGSYTPYCLLVLNGTSLGILILALQWGFAIVGIVLNLWNMRAFGVKVFSMVSYVVMGWMIVIGIPTLISSVTTACLFWLVAGGVAYTAGIVFYALGRKNSIMHCIWHVFVLLGSIFQLISITMLF